MDHSVRAAEGVEVPLRKDTGELQGRRRVMDGQRPHIPLQSMTRTYCRPITCPFTPTIPAATCAHGVCEGGDVDNCHPHISEEGNVR